MRGGVGLLLLMAAMGMGGVAVDDPPPLDPVPPPPDPDDVLRQIGPHCAKQGCRKFARWRPVVLLGGFDWQGQLPVELAFGVCQEHQGTLEDYLDTEGWGIVVAEFRRQVAARGTRVRDPKRHLSGVAHVVLAPRWASFRLQAPSVLGEGGAPLPLTAPSDWVQVLELMRTARGNAETLAEVAQVLLHHARTDTTEADAPLFSTFTEAGPTLAEWAWTAGTDLEGIALVAEAMLARAVRGG